MLEQLMCIARFSVKIWCRNSQDRDPCSRVNFLQSKSTTVTVVQSQLSLVNVCSSKENAHSNVGCHALLATSNFHKEKCPIHNQYLSSIYNFSALMLLILLTVWIIIQTVKLNWWSLSTNMMTIQQSQSELWAPYCSITVKWRREKFCGDERSNTLKEDGSAKKQRQSRLRLKHCAMHRSSHFMLDVCLQRILSFVKFQHLWSKISESWICNCDACAKGTIRTVLH